MNEGRLDKILFATWLLWNTEGANVWHHQGVQERLFTPNISFKKVKYFRASFSGKIWRFSQPFPVDFLQIPVVVSSKRSWTKKAELPRGQSKQSLFRLSIHLSLARQQHTPSLKGHCFFNSINLQKCRASLLNQPFRFSSKGKVEIFFESFFHGFGGGFLFCLFCWISKLKITQICDVSPKKTRSWPAMAEGEAFRASWPKILEDTVELPKVFLLSIGKVPLEGHALVL